MNRQCSIGYHYECSDPAGYECDCPCHNLRDIVQGIIDNPPETVDEIVFMLKEALPQ